MTLEYWFLFPVATSMFVVAFTAFAAATGHLAQFRQAGPDTMQTVASIVIFTVPGVIIGAQLGSAVAHRISQHMLERALGVLFTIVAALTLAEVIEAFHFVSTPFTRRRLHESSLLPKTLIADHSEQIAVNVHRVIEQHSGLPAN